MPVRKMPVDGTTLEVMKMHRHQNPKDCIRPRPVYTGLGTSPFWQAPGKVAISYVLTPEELTKIKDLPDEVSKPKTLYMLAVETYTKISSWDQYDLHGMVLRNWTKHVYVRRDMVVEELSRYCGDISHVLLVNICWSESGSCTLNVDITKGAWVGCDRLDVKLLCSVEDKEEWEDVTEEQVKFTRFALSRSGARVISWTFPQLLLPVHVVLLL
ncbi:hypothetical protein ARMSODRAFT_1044057 [Armillaria solidipes]|uniref:Uncharacterized protein n=1 Tax=Armillaria solidipes TaxID=1076256 RepID=A0A2H3BE64_9AGAR|nr:hypothetical protein ARMSODRAFT_1044057 [Armillaria solidipes]